MAGEVFLTVLVVVLGAVGLGGAFFNKSGDQNRDPVHKTK